MKHFIVLNYAGYEEGPDVYIIKSDDKNNALQDFILYAMDHEIDVDHPAVHEINMNVNVIDIQTLE